ncbi:MAG TPA: AAA family ATPase [Gemmatimonadaceae bacterium]
MDQDGRTQLVVRGLGRAEIVIGSLTLLPDAGMLFPLALVLAQRAGERITRTSLRDLIWPSATEKSSRHSLRQGLYRLHVAGLVHEDRGAEIVVSPVAVESDISEALLPGWPERADARIIESAATVLPGFAPIEGSALGEFTEQLRARVAAQYRRAVLHRIAAARREGRWREVGHWALMCLQADSLNEEATLARAEAEAMVGGKHEALEILDSYLRELGDRARIIGLPARMLRRRISELPDATGRRVAATSAPFVGRHDLLAAAQDTLTAARGGSATVLWLVGPAGIGKSRLLKEIERASKMAGWTVVSGDARPSFADRPFALLTDALPGLLEAPGALGAAPHALSLMRQMGTVNTDEEPLEPEEARGRQHAVYHSWVDLMDAVLGETALALLLDDVHWSDPLTLLMLARFMESRPKARLAVILSARRVPTRDDLAAARILSAVHARVGPLSDDEIRDFTFGAGLAADEQFEEVTQQLGRASGGNPLFLSHLVHRHQWRHEQSEVPNDLASLIDIQLRGLSREATRLLQACALLGQHALLPRIERALGVEAPSLVSAFGELDDMLALPTDPGVPLAPHDLWTERVRRGMTSGVFRSLAVSVARVLEADAVADGGIELYWDAARLYQESGEKQLAFTTMMRCAEYLMRTGAASEASRAYLAASELAVTAEGTANALVGRATSLQVMAEWPQLLTTVDRLRELDQQFGLAREGPDIGMMTLEAKLMTVDIGDGVGALIAIACDSDESPERRLHATFVGMIAADNVFEGETVRRFDLASHAIPHFPGDEIPRLRVRMVCEGAVGSIAASVAVAEELIHRVRAQPSKATLISTLRNTSFAFRKNGEYARSRDLLQESGSLAEKLGFIYARFRSHDALAGVAIEFGIYDMAYEALLAAESIFEPELGGFNRESLDLSWLHWAIGMGRWDDARSRVDRIGPLDLSKRSRHSLLQATARLRVLMHDGRDAEARAILGVLMGYRDSVLRHSSTDSIAVALAIGLARYEGEEQAHLFATEFLTKVRRDLMPPPTELQGLIR